MVSRGESYSIRAGAGGQGSEKVMSRTHVERYTRNNVQNSVRLKERDKLMEKRIASIRNREKEERLKRLKQIEKQKKIEERLQTMIQQKQEALRMQRVQIKAHAEELRQKQKAAAEIAREKIIETLLEWRKKEHIRKKKMEIRLAQEREKKLKTVEQKYAKR